MTSIETSQNNAGWRKNPLVGLLAAIVIVVGAVSLLSRVGCRRSQPTTDAADTVHMICPKCKTAYAVSRSQVGLDAEADVDVFHRAATGGALPGMRGRGERRGVGVSELRRPHRPTD